MQNYLIDYQEIAPLSINDLIVKLKSMEGLSIKECKVSNLVYYQGNPIYSGNGVYVFKDEERFIYVGDCVARNFVERIPAHFDIRHNGWFNSLLKNIVKKEFQQELTNENLIKAAAYSFENLRLLLLNFSPVDNDAKKIGKLETLLRMVLTPLNTFKGKRFENLDVTIADYIM